MKRPVFVRVAVGIVVALAVLGGGVSSGWSVEVRARRVGELEQRMSALEERLQTTASTSRAAVLAQELEEASALANIQGWSVANTIGWLALVFAVNVGLVGLLQLWLSAKIELKVQKELAKVSQSFDEKLDSAEKRVDSAEIRLLESRANLHLVEGQYWESAAAYEELLRLDGENLAARENLGFLYQADVLNKPEDAVNHSRVAAKLMPDKIGPRLNLLVALDHAQHSFEEFEEAAKDLLRVCKEHGAVPVTWGKAKMFYADRLVRDRQKRLPEALALYEEAWEQFNLMGEETPEAKAAREFWLGACKERRNRARGMDGRA